MVIRGVDFSRLFWYSGPAPDVPFMTADAAREAERVVVNYGVLLTSLLNFFLVAMTIFGVYRLVKTIRKAASKHLDLLPAEPPPPPAAAKICPYCKSEIPAAAVKCAHCTSDLPPEPAESASA
jgi:large conductance mechanosensitive channel